MYSSLILLPFFSLIILNLPFRDFMRKAAFWVCLSVLAFQVFLTIFPGLHTWSNSLDLFGAFLKFNFVVDSLSRLLLFSIGIVLFCGLFVQRYISRDEEHFLNFINILFLILIGTNGVVMVKDIFSLYVFLEITSVSSFILIGLNKEIGAFEAAFKYIVLSVIATVLMLLSIALLLIIAGDTSFAALASSIRNSSDPLFINFAIGIFLCSCFIKSGLMPFHGWLPDVYSQAPASASVILAGIVTKTIGVYTLIRIVSSVFGFSIPLNQILLIVGSLSIVLAALAAIGQNDFKRMLAYSSISQVGYIILGLGSGTGLGLAAAAFHLFNHSIFKSLLFINSAAVEIETGTRNMNNLSGLAKKMPLTGITSILASLSCAGIPPLSGFWSKLMIVLALWMAKFYTYAIIAVLASILTLAYYLSLQRRVFFGQLKENLSGIKEAGFSLLFPALILAAVTVLAGLFLPYMLNNFIFPVMNILGG